MHHGKAAPPECRLNDQPQAVQSWRWAAADCTPGSTAQLDKEPTGARLLIWGNLNLTWMAANHLKLQVDCCRLHLPAEPAWLATKPHGVHLPTSGSLRPSNAPRVTSHRVCKAAGGLLILQLQAVQAQNPTP